MTRIKVRSIPAPVVSVMGPRRWWSVELGGGVLTTHIALVPHLQDAHAIARAAAVSPHLGKVTGRSITYLEWGYQVGESEPVWALDHGYDGTWTASRADLSMHNIDIYDDDRNYERIRAELDRAGHMRAGRVLSRTITKVTGFATIAEPQGKTGEVFG